MKKIILNIIFLFIAFSISSQNIIQAEYYWDNDPGEGNAISLSVLDGNFNEALEAVFKNNASLPSIGNHVLGIRIKTNDGNWGSVYKRVFKVGANNNSNNLCKITQAEYFWDNDPGNGNGIALIAFDGNFNHSLESLFKSNATLPSIGNHVLGIRIKANDGNWGSVYKRVFKVDANNNSNNLCKITQAEYFWDNDPGNGNGITLIAFDGNFNHSLESIFKSNATLPSIGNHVLGIRIKANDGNWGTVFKRVFKVDANNNSNNLCKINQAEYFWDNDPGNGNGIALIAFDGNFNQALEQLSKTAITMPSSGLHLLNIRTKANDGAWGVVYKKVIGIDLVTGMVDLNYPNNDATCIELTDTLRWNGVVGYSNFEYECATDSTFNTIVYTNTVTDTLVELTNLTSNTEYFWRVRVTNGSLVGLWSEIWSFSTISTNSIVESICSNSSYSFGSQTLNQAGNYTEIFTSSTGCDSIVYLTLSVLNTITETLNETICGNSSYTLGSQNLTQTGTYTETFTSSNGCDSIVTLNLTVQTAITTDLTETICSGSSYTLGNQNLTQTGTYSETFTSSNGCDSIVTLNLTVEAAVTTNISETICAGESYLFDGQTLTQTGIYNQVLSNVNGCDSTIILDLTVFALPTTVVNYSNGELSSSSGANYQWYLNGAEINGAENQEYTPNSNGCYSVIVSDNNCTDTSTCYNIIDVSILENLNNQVSVYPNPTKNTISFNLEKEDVLSGRLFSINGKLILSFKNKTRIDLSPFAKGIYVLQIETTKGLIRKNVIKQ